MDHNQQREMMFCHQCENEWYRDEHGLACPECHSDFTEVIEADNDPRQDEQHIPGEPDFRQGSFGSAPDPDEDDIDNLRWEQTGPGTYRVRGRYNMDVPLDRNGRPQQGQQQGQGGMGQGLMGMVGNLLQGMVQGQGQQPGQQQHGERPNSSGRAGSPQTGGQQTPGGGTTFRHGHGPGFSYTVTTSSNANFGGNLFPRNANGPQPFQPQPNHLDQMLQQMFMNVGAMPGGPMRGGNGMHQHPFHNHDPFGDRTDDFMFGGPHGFVNILNMLGGPPGQHGDAVYTQEALDRIMTQLMEQHQSGNAPGPASEAAIKSLPKRTISPSDQGSEGKAECSICMDEVPLGESVTELPCHHWFHHECVKAWLSEHDTCPHCRQGIMAKDGENGGASRTPGQEPLNDMRNGGFPQQGDGSRGNPFTVPESPTMGRRTSGGGGGGGGMFGRMREAFGSGGSGNQQQVFPANVDTHTQQQRTPVPFQAPTAQQLRQMYPDASNAREARYYFWLYPRPDRPTPSRPYRYPLSSPHHPDWYRWPHDRRRHSIPSFRPLQRTVWRPPQRSYEEQAHESALRLAMEIDPVREFGYPRWRRRERTTSLPDRELTRQERRRRGRATRWPSSEAGSFRTVDSEDAGSGRGGNNAEAEMAPLTRVPSAVQTPTPALAPTPEITYHPPQPTQSYNADDDNEEPDDRTFHLPPRYRSTLSLRSTRILRRLCNRTSTFIHRADDPASLRHRISTFSLRSAQDAGTPSSRARRARAYVRDRRSSFSLRSSGTRHTISTARARARGWVVRRFAPGRVAAANDGIGTTARSLSGAAEVEAQAGDERAS